MNETHSVYKTVNKENCKFYIGVHKAVDLYDNYLGSGLILNRAIRKHGRDSFEKQILHIFETAEEAYAKERELVTQELVDSDECYNVRLGGFGGWPKGMVRSEEFKKNLSTRKKEVPRSEETKEKIRQSKIGKPHKISEETKAKLSKILKGRKFPDRVISEETKEKLRNKVCSEETREKLRKAHIGRVRKPLTEEQKEKMKLSNLGRRFSPEMKQIMQAKKMATRAANKLKTDIFSQTD